MKMKTSTIITIGVIAAFWIIVGTCNTLGCFILFTAYVSKPPIDSSYWLNITLALTGLMTILTATSVVAGIQFVRRKSWARIVLLTYSWLITLALAGVGIYGVAVNLNHGISHITYAITRLLGLLVLPTAMLYFLQSKEIRSAMTAEHAPPAGTPEAGRP